MVHSSSQRPDDAPLLLVLLLGEPFAARDDQVGARLGAIVAHPRGLSSGESASGHEDTLQKSSKERARAD